MPHADQRGQRSRDRPEYDDPERDEAARFLYSSMDPRPMIRGIRDMERLRAWRYVAAKQGDKTVVEWLNDRADDLAAEHTNE